MNHGDGSSPKYRKVGELTAEIKAYHCTGNDTVTAVASRLGPPKIISGRPTWMCPFHAGHHPSFSVNMKGKRTGGCGCRGCGTYFTTPIDFIKEYDGIQFADAVLETAAVLGLDTDYGEKTVQTHAAPPVRPAVPEKPQIEPAALERTNLAYTFFMASCRGTDGQLILSDAHRNELRTKRNYTDAQIREFGFFTFPGRNSRAAWETVKLIKAAGLSPEDVLKYIPGFWYDRKTGHWECAELFGSGYGFPIRDENGNILAIQIRVTDAPKGEGNGRKYTWFTSASAMYTEEDSGQQRIFGNTPGTPIGTVYPVSGKSRRILVTEGYHKAIHAARIMKNTHTAVTVQGVSSTAGIADYVDRVRKISGSTGLDIAFDGDFAMNIQVLRPALKLGFTLSGLTLPPELEAAAEDVLSSEARTPENMISRRKKEALAISAFLRENAGNMKFSDISYPIWVWEEEKGLDDLVDAGKENRIRSLSFADFWELGYMYLCIDCAERLRTAEEDRIKAEKDGINTADARPNYWYVMARIPDERRKKLFRKCLDALAGRIRKRRETEKA